MTWINHGDTTSTDRPPEPTFTGDVTFTGYFQRDAPSRLAGATLTFGAGARSPWKQSPAGQTLVVVSGAGLVQTKGEGVTAVRVGDCVWFPPGVWHWNGAAPDAGTTMVEVEETVDGSHVEFGAAVTDEEYGGPRSA